MCCARRTVNIHLINSAGVESYNMGPCIECWCRGPALQAQGYHGGGGRYEIGILNIASFCCMGTSGLQAPRQKVFGALREIF